MDTVRHLSLASCWLYRADPGSGSYHEGYKPGWISACTRVARLHCVVMRYGEVNWWFLRESLLPFSSWSMPLWTMFR